MRHSTITRIVVLALALAAVSAPASWADGGPPLIVPDQSSEHAAPGVGSQPLIVPDLSTEHVSPSGGSEPMIVPVHPSTEHGGAVSAPPPAVIVRTGGGFDWASAGIGALSAVGLALIALAAVAMRARRMRTA
jgi:hypothetical protein